MTEKNLPVLGVSTTVKALPLMLDWVLDKQRDLELQDPSFTPMFDNDWSHIDPRFIPDSIMLADWRDVAKQAILEWVELPTGDSTEPAAEKPAAETAETASPEKEQEEKTAQAKA